MTTPDPSNAQYPDPDDLPSSKVHPIETTQQGLMLEPLANGLVPRPEFSIQPLSLQEAIFMHGGWHHDRRRVWAAFDRMHVRSTRCEAFRCCGSALWLEASGDEMRLKANACHDRWCQACQRRAVASVRLELAKLWKPGNTRFITLTLKHSTTPLKEQIKRLRSCFQELRRRPLWKHSVTGGAAFVEVKIGRDELWHPHLHLIVEGVWIEGAELARLWHAVTGDSYVIDIRRPRDEQTVVHYVTKYVTKPADADVFRTPERLDECIMAMKGIRIMSCFGSWKGVKLRGADQADDVTWKPIGRVDAIMNARDAQAVRWREAALRRWPRLSVFIRPTLANTEHIPP